VVVKMPEVELRPGIVAGKDLVVVQDNRVDLVRVVELCTFVLVNDEGQEAAVLIRRATFGRSRTSVMIETSSAGACHLFGNPRGHHSLDCELTEVLDRVTWLGWVLFTFLLLIIIYNQARLAFCFLAGLLVISELLV
jgi:hypothetical protein